MKQFNSQSVSRQLKRGHIRFLELTFLKNEDGSNKIIKQRKTTRGRWLNT